MNDVKYTIREAKEEDCPEIMRLIQELADFEKLSDQVKISADVLKRDGFGKERFYQCLVAETEDRGDDKEHRLIGYCLYFYCYSTFEGRAMYMEDLYVSPAYRGCGIGTKMWKKVTQIALDNLCVRLQFSVLDWNVKAMDIYRSKSAQDLTEKEGWHFMRMDEKAMREFASSE